MRAGNKFRALTLCLASVTAGSCQHSWSGEGNAIPQRTAQASGGASLRELISEIDSRRLTLRSFSAQMKIKMTRANGEKVSLDATYLGDHQGNLRLRLSGMFKVLALDLAVLNGRVSCWMPLQKRAIAGTRESLVSDGASELALLAAIGNASDLFFPRPWSSGAASRRANMKGDSLVVRSFGAGGEKFCLGCYVIDPSERAITRQDVFNRAGTALGTAEYTNFSSVETLLDSKSDAPQFNTAQRFPRRIHLADAGGRMVLDVVVNKIVLNPVVAEGAYVLNLPADLTVSDMGPVLASGKPLFEK